MKVVSVVGARPNYMKVAPLVKRLRATPGVDSILVHTGQHYDSLMSDRFFMDLDLPEPDINLGIGPGTHAQQTAKALVGCEKLLQEHRPDWVIVVGDVNSTVACALAAAKLQIRIAHVEAGLRSFDRRMPEEVNRVLTDHLARLLFTHSEEADGNLIREGIPVTRICNVGNVMIDALLSSLERASQSTILEDLGVRTKSYALMTLHRPENVDRPETLLDILDAVSDVQELLPVIFPVHPRTQRCLEGIGPQRGTEFSSRFRRIDPLGYLDFLQLMRYASFVLTDSGGVQEETTFLGVPCITLRETTERPVTVRLGTNEVVGTNRERIRVACEKALSREGAPASIPPLWDGHTADRIVEMLLKAPLTEGDP